MADFKKLIEDNFNDYCTSNSKLLTDSMLYSLNAGGKRLRPVLFLAFFNLFNENINHAIPFASTLEMIHTYSLIHDDLPCMDNDDLRRGKPTNHKVFPEDIALLAGDSLLNTAFETFSNPEYTKHFSADKVLKALHELARCSGKDGMIYGQILDTQNEINSINDLILIHKNKTGKLLVASCVCGAILGGATDNEVEKIRDFAINLGIAFQIKDDILDKFGDTKTLGKEINSDEKLNKKTYTSFYNQEKCEELVLEYTENALKNLQNFENTDYIESLAKSLVKRDY